MSLRVQHCTRFRMTACRHESGKAIQAAASMIAAPRLLTLGRCYLTLTVPAPLPIKHAAGGGTHLDGRRQLLLGSLIRERALRHERVPVLLRLVGT